MLWKDKRNWVEVPLWMPAGARVLQIWDDLRAWDILRLPDIHSEPRRQPMSFRFQPAIASIATA